jgi:hypothetical protein
MSLEECLEYIKEDELVEVTPSPCASARPSSTMINGKRLRVSEYRAKLASALSSVSRLSDVIRKAAVKRG